MSNGGPGSGAPYIIICSIRIRIQNATTAQSKIVAASEGASQLASFMELRYPGRVRPIDLKEIATLQHEMMDNLQSYDLDGANAACREMMRLLYELEKKFI